MRTWLPTLCHPTLLRNTLQMAAPRVVIGFHLATGVGACMGAMHAHPTQNFYKRDASRISWLTFQLAAGGNTL